MTDLNFKKLQKFKKTKKHKQITTQTYPLLNSNRQHILNKLVIMLGKNKKKGNLFQSITGPLNWVLTAVGGIRFIDVHAQMGLNWSHLIQLVMWVDSRAKPGSIPFSFRSQSPYIVWKKWAKNNRTFIRSFFSSETAFCCTSTYSKKILIVKNDLYGNMANISYVTNHFNKRFVCAPPKSGWRTEWVLTWAGSATHHKQPNWIYQS